MQLGSFTLSSFTYLLLTLDSSGVLPTFAIDYNPLLFEALHTLILYTAVDFAHNSAHDRQFFTHPSTYELDRPSYCQAASTL